MIGHVNPDMDSFSSVIALYLGLNKMSKNVYPISKGPFVDPVLPYEKIFKNTPPDEYDLIISVDTADLNRIDLDSENANANVVVIDHHVSNKGFGIINWINSSFISASEMVMLLLISLNEDFVSDSTETSILDSEISQVLLNGILFDNGYFRHIRTDKYLSLYFSGFLIENGADIKKTYDYMYKNLSFENLKFLGRVLERTEKSDSCKVIWTYFDKNEINIEIDSSIIFQNLMVLKESDIFILFKTSENEVEISFRSLDGYDVSEIAGKFGGGGHKVAAGCTVKGNFNDIKSNVLSEIKKIINW